MSISNQRNSLRRSSISINIIRDSISGLSKGIRNLRQNANQILLTTQNNNNFKRTLTRKDNDFFNRRRENVLRKEREDELESASVTGVTRKQGNLFQQSTRGFFGRILDFLGVLLIGWALQNLPKFIAAFEKLFKLISTVVEVMGGFIKTITNFLTGIATGIGNLFGVLNRFDFAETGNKLKELIDKGAAGLFKLNKEFVQGIQSILGDREIRKAAFGGGVSGGNNQSTQDDFGVVEDDNQDDNQDDTGGDVEINVEEIEGRQDGGDVEKDVPVVVGEKGKEIFVPETDGTIIPNQETEEFIAGVNSSPDDEEVVETMSKEDSLKETDKFVNDEFTGGVEKLLGSAKKPEVSKKEIIPKEELEKNITDAEKLFNKGGKNQIQEDLDEKVKPTKKEIPDLKPGRNKNRRKVVVIEKTIPVNSPSSSSTSQRVSLGGGSNSSASTLLSFQSVSSLKYT
mgnify:CR=1 FL=1